VHLGRVNFAKSIRGYAEKFGKEVIDPCLETMFDSLGEAYDFYNCTNGSTVRD
jgi:hypothetical protein